MRIYRVNSNSGKIDELDKQRQMVAAVRPFRPDRGCFSTLLFARIVPKIPKERIESADFGASRVEMGSSQRKRITVCGRPLFSSGRSAVPSDGNKWSRDGLVTERRAEQRVTTL